MASECELCISLGVTTVIKTENGETAKAHAEIHARQLCLIIDDFECTIEKSGTEANGPFPKEKSKKSTLLSLCRELITTHGNVNSVKCSQCDRLVTVRSNRREEASSVSLINHACIHLNKELFACRQCDLKFITRGGIRTHLKRIHSLGSIGENYIDKTEDHQNDIIDMIKLCFGKAPPKKLSVTAIGDQKRNCYKKPLSKLAASLLAKHQPGDTIKCHICSWTITKNILANRQLVTHARKHLDKPIFSCALCQFSASTEYSIYEHLRSKHSVAQSQKNFKDASAEWIQEISSMLEDCFGDQKRERPPAISKEEARTLQTRKTIKRRCGANSLLAERQVRCSDLAQKFQQSGNLQCRICQKRLKVMIKAHTTNLAIPMRHALSHFNKLLFSCRHCSHCSTNKDMMRHHMRTKHNGHGKNEFDDRTNDFHSDIMEMLSKCFNWDLEPESSGTSSTVAPKDRTVFITSMAHGDDLKAARLVHAYELIRNHAVGGKIICKVCDQIVPTIQQGTISSMAVFIHARTHLDIHYWPFRCTLCSYRSANRSTMVTHMRNIHVTGQDGNKFEDVSNRFNPEIMACLSECYDWNIADECVL